MDDVFQSFVDVLGQSIGDVDLAPFISGLGPLNVLDQEICQSFHFRQAGINMNAVLNDHTTSLLICGVTFLVDLAHHQNNNWCPYRGVFINGVTTEDGISQVVQKVCIDPTDWFAEDVLQLRYDFPDYVLEFHFRGPVDSQMTLASLRDSKNNPHCGSASDSRQSIRLGRPYQ